MAAAFAHPTFFKPSTFDLGTFRENVNSGSVLRFTSAIVDLEETVAEARRLSLLEQDVHCKHQLWMPSSIHAGRGDLDEVKSKGGPLFICALASYFTANLFLGMMDETVMALLTSLSIDRGVNGEGEEKFGPPTFHDSIQKMPNADGTPKDGYNKVNESNQNDLA